MIAAEKRPQSEIHRYGVIAPGKIDGNVLEVKAWWRNRRRKKRRRFFALSGRYILPAEIFIELDRKEKGAGGEIQLTDSMQKLIGRHPFHAVVAKCDWYDCGDKGGFSRRQYRSRAHAP